MKVLFITNLCPQYRVAPFELLARRHEMVFCFFSEGDEPYWDRDRSQGQPRVERIGLRGFSPLPRLRVTPGLVPLILQHDWDVIIKCINGRFALPITYALSRLRGIPFVLWTETWRTPRSLIHLLAAPAVRRVYRGANAICVCGPHVTSYLQEEGVDPSRIHTVPQNVDREIFDVEPSPALKERWRQQLDLGDKPVVLYVGRLVPEKGLKDLLAAFSLLSKQRPATLVLAGDGSMREVLERDARRRLPGQVRFIGNVPNHELPPLYALAACLILPSRTTRMFREPWGLVVNEAFHQGVPAIVSDAVGAAAGGLVQDGRNGFVFPEGNVQILADRMAGLLADEALRMRLSACARETVRAWNPVTMVDGFCNAIEQVTGHGAVRRSA